MEKTLNKKAAKIMISLANIILFIIMVTINALADILPINGKNTGELSDKYPNLFVPAGFSFSIWGVIYLLLMLYVGYHWFAAINGKEKIRLRFIDNLVFGLTCVLNFLWILVWHYELIFLSFLIMIVLLVSLIYLFIRIDKLANKGIMEEIALKLPISVYLGWISVATIANITVLLVYWKWDGFGIPQNIWTILVIAVGTILAMLMLILRKNIAYSLVIVWAYAGIIIKRISQDVVYNDIIYTCYITIAVIVLFIFITAFGEIKKIREQKSVSPK
jgi:hypothetical protein